MRATVVIRRVILAAIFLVLPVIGYAQEAALTGTITDSTGGVLPGVTVQATHEASGNTFEAVTDQRGAYRIPARIGEYRITATLTGFSTATRTGVQLLVGQTVTLNLQLAPSTLQETVTVTGESPLIETSSSSVGGNIDPRQLSELPVEGRSWMSLALLAPGNRTNAEGATPVQDRTNVREFAYNVDGNQVNANMGAGAQPRYGKDSIAEFQFISNRFDATQGRSSGVQVNVITKSGSNTASGSFSGNFRNSRFIAADPVLHVVVPYSNQQYSGTFGGPIVKDKVHFFASYEYEHEPRTSIWNTPYPAFNVQLTGTRTVKMPSLRLDYQLSPKTRLMTKAAHSRLWEPFTPGNNSHPAAANTNLEYSTDYVVQLTRVMGNRVNELKGGYSGYGFNQAALTSWSHHWLAPAITNAAPRITFTGFAIAGNSNLPRYRVQDVYSLRDDFTFSYDGKGRHDVKTGGEYLHYADMTRNCSNCMGIIDAQGGAVPANIEALFPDAFNADTWNLAAISPIVRRYTLGVSDTSFRTPLPMNKYAAWMQDDWKMSSRMTLNLGLRYDLIWNAVAQYVVFEPFEPAGRSQNAKDFQPRLGFAYTLNDKTVLRGGAGLYYADVFSTNLLWPVSPLSIAQIGVASDGRADFAVNPFNGPAPSYTQALQRFCYVSNAAGCLFRDAPQLAPLPEYGQIQHSWQSSIGVARQVGATMAINADYVFTGSRAEEQSGLVESNINVSYNPATGANYPFSDISHRPYPTWGIVGIDPHTGESNYNALQTSFTKRMSNHWQGSATYTLGHLKDRVPPPLSGLHEVTFPVAADLGGEYGLSRTDQRHRFVYNGIWQPGFGFQTSGIYFYGSGERFVTSYGGDSRGLGVNGSARLRPNGTIVPRNNFVGQPIHRVDLRFQQHLPFGGHAGIDGMLEVFNAFNRANYGGYTTQESNRQYGLPASSTNLAYAPRTLQFGFRMTF